MYFYNSVVSDAQGFGCVKFALTIAAFRVRMLFMKALFHTYQTRLAVLFALIINAGILIVFHDQYWWPQDDGVFAYLADQILKERVYGVDFYDIHPGYHSFVNALMMKIFGHEMVVMRYPIIVMGAAQSMIAAYLLRQHGFIIAVLASVTITGIGFVQLMTASPTWYALFFAFMCVFIVSVFKHSLKRSFALGVMIGLCFMFRHPSGIFLGFGVLAYFIYHSFFENQRQAAPRYLCYALLAMIIASLAVYSYLLFASFAFVLLGAFPILALLLIGMMGRLDDQALLKGIVPSGLGAIAAILPMIIYQMAYGDLGSWFYHSFLTGSKILETGFFFKSGYWHYPVGFFQLFFNDGLNPAWIIKAAYWVLILSFPFVLGLIAIRGMITPYQQNKRVHGSIFIALFFGIVSFYYQIPMYFYNSIALSVIVILMHISIQERWQKLSVMVGLLFIIMTAFFFETAPSSTVFKHDYRPSDIRRLGVEITDEQDRVYMHLLDVIERNSKDNDPIYVYPMNPEIYYLSQRKNPFPYYGSSFYIYDENGYISFYNSIQEMMPALVIYNTGTKYLSEYDRQFADALVNDLSYRMIDTIGDFQIFKPAVH